MPKVYTVTSYKSVSDPTALAAHSALAGLAIAAAGGRIIGRGLPLATFENGLDQRVVIIEWDSLDQAVAIYQTDGYRKALERLGDAADRDIRIIEGVEA
jgi:uncharacterized protein (DUF1330 family)